MTLTIELTDAEAARLRALAAAKGTDEETVLHDLIQGLPETYGLPQTEAEWEALEAELSEGLENVPPLPAEATSRAAFYRDRV